MSLRRRGNQILIDLRRLGTLLWRHSKLHPFTTSQIRSERVQLSPSGALEHLEVLYITCDQTTESPCHQQAALVAQPSALVGRTIG
eukprot:748733-Hanusia_phi.AAC.4